jgi:hypothetical protein
MSKINAIQGLIRIGGLTALKERITKDTKGKNVNFCSTNNEHIIIISIMVRHYFVSEWNNVCTEKLKEIGINILQKDIPFIVDLSRKIITRISNKDRVTFIDKDKGTLYFDNLATQNKAIKRERRKSLLRNKIFSVVRGLKDKYVLPSFGPSKQGVKIIKKDKEWIIITRTTGRINNVAKEITVSFDRGIVKLHRIKHLRKKNKVSTFKGDK